MRKSKLLFNGIFILILILTSFGNTHIAQAGNGNDEPKADPRLLQMAEENPDATFMVIVQKEAKNKILKDLGLADAEAEDGEPEGTELEEEVLKGGGQIKQKLDLIVSFSAEMTGKEIVKLARHPKVRWISADAPMVSTATAGMDTALDNFTSASYSGSNGNLPWASSWIEYGESSTMATNGLIQAINSSYCSGGSGYCLRFDPYVAGLYIYRKLDLSNVASASLSFYRNNVLTSEDGAVALEISSNGGTTWTTLRTYSRTSYLGSGTDRFDIAAFASANTWIRFRVTDTQIGYYYAYFDNIQVQYARASAFLSTTRANQLSLTGSGVTVAVIDSGITTNHADFITNGSSRVITSTKFGNNLTTEDMYGHGSHVAGIIGGNGTSSGGKYKGMAPGVNLVNLKTSDAYGKTYESDVVSALQWVYNNRAAYNIKVVNISMNSTVAQSYHTSPLAAAVEILWFNKIVVVVSAGNNGTANGSSTLYPPANDPFVITVGATEDKGTASLTDDTMAVFSAYGTTQDGYFKPDIVAPGRNIIAPLGGLLNLAFQTYPLHRVNDYYFRMSGTSMSAPVVSGAVALLLQDEPNLTPDQVKYRLLSTANKNWTNYNSAKAGAGSLDIYAAVYGTSTQSANTSIQVSQMLTTGNNPVTWGSVGWNSVGWNSVGWNSVGWNSVGWNSVGWNSVGWNTSTWDE